MLKFFFLAALFISITSSSPTTVSFSDEQTKIMTLFNNINASTKRAHSGHYFYLDFKDNFRQLLSLDSVTFLKEMSQVTDKFFLFTLWNTFNSIYLFLCSSPYNKKTQKNFRDFVAQFHLLDYNYNCASNMLYHFKVYLMQALATYEGNKTEMLFRAEDFYILRLKGLILEVLDGLTGYEICKQIKEMYEIFRFFHQCTEMKNLKSMLIREFRMFKSAMKSKNNKLIELHTENITLLAGILKNDRSTIYGLQLIADQTPEFVRFFLLVQYNQPRFLQRPFIIGKNEPEIHRNELLRYLYEKIPIFECQIIPLTSKFKLLKEFTNDYEGISSRDALIDLTKTLFGKI
jgi:hypothetical protein